MALIEEIKDLKKEISELREKLKVLDDEGREMPIGPKTGQGPET